jgi:hypothetical protein
MRVSLMMSKATCCLVTVVSVFEVVFRFHWLSYAGERWILFFTMLYSYFCCGAVFDFLLGCGYVASRCGVVSSCASEEKCLCFTPKILRAHVVLCLRIFEQSSVPHIK